MAFAVLIMGFLEEEAIRENSVVMKTLRDNIDPFSLTDQQFIKVFRLSKDSVHYLCNVLQPTLQRRRRNGLHVRTQVIMFIKTYVYVKHILILKHTYMFVDIYMHLLILHTRIHTHTHVCVYMYILMYIDMYIFNGYILLLDFDCITFFCHWLIPKRYWK